MSKRLSMVFLLGVAGLSVAAWVRREQLASSASRLGEKVETWAQDSLGEKTKRVSPKIEATPSVPATLAALLEVDGIAETDPVARSKRRTLLLEWLQTDFPAALEYCRALGYEDLADASVAEYVAMRASVDQIAEAIAGSADPVVVARGLIRGAGLEKVQQLLLTADRYEGEAGKGFAGAMGGYLAEKNIDAAILFAGGRTDETQRSAAIAAVVEQLASEGKNSEVQFLYEALDEKLREADPVKFAYGQSLHDADPETALGVLYSIQDPALRQVAVLSFARKMEAAQPGVAISAVMASGMAGADQARHVERIVGDWLILDRESAQAWLRSAKNLPADLRARLEAKIR